MNLREKIYLGLGHINTKMIEKRGKKTNKKDTEK